MRYVLCIGNAGYEFDLMLLRVYRVLPDEMGERAGQLRIVDNTGEDYLYPTKRFVPVDLPAEAEAAFEQAFARA